MFRECSSICKVYMIEEFDGQFDIYICQYENMFNLVSPVSSCSLHVFWTVSI